jgi:hypothetical protein
MKYTDQQLINYLFDHAPSVENFSTEGAKMVKQAAERLSQLTGLPYQYPYGTAAEHVRGKDE